ncbi:hypothetical protein [Methanothrix soehngenii]|jgi:hypothetical protein
MDTGPIIILANDQKCCYYQSSIQYIARIITTILHHNRDTTVIILAQGFYRSIMVRYGAYKFKGSEINMTTFEEIHHAFFYVSSDDYGMNRAFLCLDNGEIIYRSEWDDPKEEDEDEFDCDHFIEIPHKNDLDLGQTLVIEFAEVHLQDDLDLVQRIFSRRGAYRRFKELLDERGLLQTLYDYEDIREKEALGEWVQDNEIELESQTAKSS